jgi:hypothetical protein
MPTFLRDDRPPRGLSAPRGSGQRFSWVPSYAACCYWQANLCPFNCARKTGVRPSALSSTFRSVCPDQSKPSFPRWHSRSDPFAYFG